MFSRNKIIANPWGRKSEIKQGVTNDCLLFVGMDFAAHPSVGNF